MKNKIKNLIQESRKSRNSTDMMAYQYVMSAIQTVEGRSGKDITDDEVFKIIEKEIKSLKEMVECGNAKNDEEKMVDTLLKLLPEKIDVSKYNEIVHGILLEVSASSIKDMGNVMSRIKTIYGSSVDNKIISNIVRSKLSE